MTFEGIRKMSANRTWLVGAEKHIELLEESWEQEPEEPPRVREFEEFLAEAVMVFSLLDQVCRLRREYIYRGLEEPTAEGDASEKNLFGRRLAVAAKAIRKLEFLEQSLLAVERVERTRACLEIARSFLGTWTPAVQAMALGSRVVEFSDEDADQIHALLNSPPRSLGGLVRPG